MVRKNNVPKKVAAIVRHPIQDGWAQ
jgi:hypothetical protein